MDVKAFYEQIGGNYSDAVATMMTDAFIERMLQKFLANNAFSALREHYAAKDFRGVFEASHSLKGVCGNLALTPLYLLASEICEMTRSLPEGQTVEIGEPMKKITEEYEKIASLLTAAFPA